MKNDLFYKICFIFLVNEYWIKNNARQRFERIDKIFKIEAKMIDCMLVVNTFSCLDQVTWPTVLTFFPFVLLFVVATYSIYKMSKF